MEKRRQMANRLKSSFRLLKIEAIADFGNSNATVQLLSPILSSEASRLLGKWLAYLRPTFWRLSRDIIGQIKKGGL